MWKIGTLCWCDVFCGKSQFGSVSRINAMSLNEPWWIDHIMVCPGIVNHVVKNAWDMCILSWARYVLQGINTFDNRDWWRRDEVSPICRNGQKYAEMQCLSPSGMIHRHCYMLASMQSPIHCKCWKYITLDISAWWPSRQRYQRACAICHTL